MLSLVATTLPPLALYDVYHVYSLFRHSTLSKPIITSHFELHYLPYGVDSRLQSLSNMCSICEQWKLIFMLWCLRLFCNRREVDVEITSAPKAPRWAPVMRCRGTIYESWAFINISGKQLCWLLLLYLSLFLLWISYETVFKVKCVKMLVSTP